MRRHSVREVLTAQRRYREAGAKPAPAPPTIVLSNLRWCAPTPEEWERIEGRVRRAGQTAPLQVTTIRVKRGKRRKRSRAA